MSRTIKFRAWHKEEKRMFEVCYLSWFSGIFLVGDKDASDEQRYGSGEVILMQFTGLLDAKGQEIYEGDILKTQNSPDYRGDDEPYYGQVRYEDQGAMFIIVQPHATYTPSLSNLLIESREIVGNIYENHDLLNAHNAKQ